MFRLEEKKRTDSFSFVTDDDISAHSVAESKRIKVFPIPVTEIELSRALFPPPPHTYSVQSTVFEIRYLASSLCHTFCLIIFLPVSGGRGLSDCMGPRQQRRRVSIRLRVAPLLGLGRSRLGPRTLAFRYNYTVI